MMDERSLVCGQLMLPLLPIVLIWLTSVRDHAEGKRALFYRAPSVLLFDPPAACPAPSFDSSFSQLKTSSPLFFDPAFAKERTACRLDAREWPGVPLPTGPLDVSGVVVKGRAR